jgi:hypothetical protein
MFREALQTLQMLKKTLRLSRFGFYQNKGIGALYFVRKTLEKNKDTRKVKKEKIKTNRGKKKRRKSTSAGEEHMK